MMAEETSKEPETKTEINRDQKFSRESIACWCLCQIFKIRVCGIKNTGSRLMVWCSKSAIIKIAYIHPRY
jgi:hypothetical protein